MYVAPNSEIKLLSNVPIGSDYKNSFYFASLSDQLTYFNSKVKATFTQQSYTRVNRGYIRIDASADTLYDCNYLMFRNTSFGNKWFFAFINAVEYINNACTEISFTIDSLMTWYFEMEVPPCFIIRQHTYNDEIGANIEPEPLQLGEYVYEDYGMLSPLIGYDFAYIVLNADSEVQPDDDVQQYGRVIAGVTVYVFYNNSSDRRALRTLIDRYLDNPDNIVAIYCVPSWLVPDGSVQSDHRLRPGTGYMSQTITDIDAIDENSDFGSYHPTNNKLYTYPYNYYHVDNANGQSLALRYEFFKDHKPNFWVRGTVLSPVQVVLNPMNYKGINTASELQTPQPVLQESLSLQSFPQCSWNIDSFKAWLSQNSVPLALTGLANAIKLYTFAPSMFTSAPITESSIIKTPASYGQASLGVFNQTDTHRFKVEGKEQFNPKSLAPASSSALDTASTIYQASIMADVCKNQTDVGNTNCATGHQTFFSGRAHLNLEEIKHIDSFFNAYGYAVNKVETPHLGAHREGFCYIQTRDCLVKGDLPNDDKVMIQNILNAGIRFWNRKTNVGDLSQNNAII